MAGAPHEQTGETKVLDRGGLAALVDLLRHDGRTVIGPTVRDGAIVLDEIDSIGDLPEGWADDQEGGSYRLHRRGDRELFGYAVGPRSFKQFLFPPRTLMIRTRRTTDGFAVDEGGAGRAVPRFAFFGARACEVAAIAVQDRVFTAGDVVDPEYAARRRDAVIISVDCGRPAATCFCTSMGTGPAAEAGFDVAITEVCDPDGDGGGDRYVARSGSALGARLVAELPGRAVSDPDRAAAGAVVEGARAAMGRHLDTTGIAELLKGNPEHPRWQEVAERCIACGNCTMACPTCFCNRTDDSTDVAGETAERWRSWDSCYTLDFSYVHGIGDVRSTIAGRYRQWLTHKLATWFDQFGESGCVGCGRCITWCPVGIDLTEEVAAIRGGAPA